MPSAGSLTSWSVRRLIRPVKGRLVVLIYHRVHPMIDPIFPNEVDATTFEWQMRLLAEHLVPLDLEEAIRLRDLGKLPAGAVAVTFDDGYADNAEVALPILQRTRVPATFFVTTGYLNGGRMWNDTVIETVRRLPSGQFDLTPIGLGVRAVSDAASRRALIREIIQVIKHRPPRERQELADAIRGMGSESLPDTLMMSSAQVRELCAAGMGLGAHTLTHPILKSASPTVARDEIEGCRRELAAITGTVPALFAYPNGKPGSDYAAEHCDMVRSAGYRAALSTRRGAVGPQSDPWQLPRFTPWDRTPARFLARLLLEYRNPV